MNRAPFLRIFQAQDILFGGRFTSKIHLFDLITKWIFYSFVICEINSKIGEHLNFFEYIFLDNEFFVVPHCNKYTAILFIKLITNFLVIEDINFFKLGRTTDVFRIGKSNQVGKITLISYRNLNFFINKNKWTHQIPFIWLHELDSERQQKYSNVSQHTRIPQAVSSNTIQTQKIKKSSNLIDNDLFSATRARIAC